MARLRSGAGVPRVLVDDWVGDWMQRAARAYERRVTRTGALKIGAFGAAEVALRSSALIISWRGAAHTEALIKYLRERCPWTCIYLLAPRSPDVTRVLTDLARAGLDDWHDADGTDIHVRLGAMLDRRKILPAFTDGTGNLRQSGSGIGAQVARWCLRNGDRRVTADQAAVWFGEHRKTLNCLLKRETRRSLSYWLREGRLLFAKGMLDVGFSQSDVALAMGYSTGAGVGMMMRRADRC